MIAAPRARLPVAAALAAAAALALAFCVLNPAGDAPTPDGGTLRAAVEDFPLDDAWIHQVYVRGLWRDGAPTYNPGEPEAGFSSLLWLLAQVPGEALVARGDASPVVVSKATSLLFAVLAALATARLAARLGGDRAATVAAALLLLASPGFAFSAVSGMEVTLTTLMVLLALDAHDRGSPLAAGTWAGLAALARPEAALAGPVLAAAAALRPGPAAARAGRVLRLALPPLLLGALWATYTLRVTGHPLPNTFYVKAGGAPLADRLAYWADALLVQPGPAWVATAAALTAAGAARAWRSAPTRPLLLALLGTLAATLAGVVAVHALPAHTTFYGQRYAFPFTALAAAPAGLGASAALASLRPRLGRAAPAAVALALAALVAAPLDAARRSYGAHCLDVHRLHTVPALEARARTPEGAVLAAEGAGAARYLSGRRVVDLVGLNDHRLAHLGGDRAAGSCLVLAARPSLFLVPEGWRPVVDGLFATREVARYTSPAWSVRAFREPRTVVALEASPRPEALARCAARSVPR